jgi:predicted NBD/HSP70 family sugar kinase
MQGIELSNSERLILEIIRRERTSTRVEVAKRLDFSKVQATNLAKSLLDKKLIIDQASPSGARGQPVKMIRLNADALYSVGVTFTGAYMEIALVDWTGVIKVSDSVKLQSQHSLDALCQSIAEFIEQKLKPNSVARKKFYGVGISIPGDFTYARRKMNAVYFPELENVDLMSAFSSRLDYPVYIENDGTCAAWGESVAGAGNAFDHFVFVHIGHGIGGGIIIDRRVYRGRNGNAGAFGAPFPHLDQSRPSGADLLKTLRSHGIEVDDFAELRALSVDTCEPLKAWLKGAAEQLAQPLTVLARALDPQAIIIGGRLPLDILQAWLPYIDNDKFCQFDKHKLPVPELIASKLGDLGGVVGASQLCFEHSIFAKQTF